MYAVVRTGGKQYKVAAKDVIAVEKLDSEIGQVIELDQVLAMDTGDGVTLGDPLVGGARVTATVLDQRKGAKVTVFKKKRRKNYRRRRGHRQPITVLRIGEILAKGQQPAEPEADPVMLDSEETAASDDSRDTVIEETNGDAEAAMSETRDAADESEALDPQDEPDRDP